jgi:hypothetical protein
MREVSSDMETRRGFLSAVGALTGAFAATAEGAAQRPPVPPGWRFGRGAPPRLSVTVPAGWFFTETLTDVGDPVQLFAIASREIPAPHANIHGLVNPNLIPSDAVLVTAHGFRLTQDMEEFAARTAAPPGRVRVADMPATPFGGLGLTTRSWAHIGMAFAIQIFVWAGDAAPSEDLQRLEGVLASLTFDQSL